MVISYYMKTFLIIIFLFTSIIVRGQQYPKKIIEITDDSVVKVLGRIENFMVKQGKQFRISFFVISNGSGSANISQGDEISENIIISVTEYDEYPINRVFNVGTFYMPRLIGGKDLDGRYCILVEHGAADKRKKNKLLIYLDKVIIE